MKRRMAGPGPGLRIGACLVFFLIHTSLAAPIENEEEGQTQVQEYLGQDLEPSGCYYNFQHYDEGDRIITNEPCLNCTCHNRMLMCYLRVCPFTKAIGQDCTVEKKADQCCPVINCPEVPVQLLTSSTTEKSSETALGQISETAVGHLDDFGCKINDLFYTDGAQVPGDPTKPCELCYCIRNRTACVMQECTLRVEGCRPIYEEGVCCPVKYDCDYEETSRTTTTEPPSSTPGLILTTTTAGPLDCRHDGHTYADGASIETTEPCEHCYCMRGEIVCAVQECGTPLDKQNCTAVAPPPGTCCPENFICDDNEVDGVPRQDRKHSDDVNMTAEVETTEPEIEATVSEIYPRPEKSEEKPLHVNEIPTKDGIEHVAVTDKISTEGNEEKQPEAASEEPENIVPTEESIKEDVAVTSEHPEHAEEVQQPVAVTSEHPEHAEEVQQLTESNIVQPMETEKPEIATEEPISVEASTSAPAEEETERTVTKAATESPVEVPVTKTSPQEEETSGVTESNVPQGVIMDEVAPSHSPEEHVQENVETTEIKEDHPVPTILPNLPEYGTEAPQPVESDNLVTEKPAEILNKPVEDEIMQVTEKTVEESPEEKITEKPVEESQSNADETEAITEKMPEQSEISDKINSEEKPAPAAQPASSTASPDRIVFPTETSETENQEPAVEATSSVPTEKEEIQQPTEAPIVQTDAPLPSNSETEDKQEESVTELPAMNSEQETSTDLPTKNNQEEIVTEAPSQNSQEEIATEVPTKNSAEEVLTEAPTKNAEEPAVSSSESDNKDDEQIATEIPSKNVEENIATESPTYEDNVESTEVAHASDEVTEKQQDESEPTAPVTEEESQQEHDVTESVLHETSQETTDQHEETNPAVSHEESNEEIDVTTQRAFYEEPTEKAEEQKLTPETPLSEAVSPQDSFAAYDDTTEQAAVTSAPHIGIPGEGSCLVDKETYPNNSVIPPVSSCQTSCRCISSIVHCTLVNCPPPPPGMRHCAPHKKENECCPSYLCDGDEKPDLESGSYVTEAVTELIGNRVEDFPVSPSESSEDVQFPVKEEEEATTTKVELEITTVRSPSVQQEVEAQHGTEAEEESSNEVVQPSYVDENNKEEELPSATTEISEPVQPSENEAVTEASVVETETKEPIKSVPESSDVVPQEHQEENKETNEEEKVLVPTETIPKATETPELVTEKMANEDEPTQTERIEIPEGTPEVQTSEEMTEASVDSTAVPTEESIPVKPETEAPAPEETEEVTEAPAKAETESPSPSENAVENVELVTEQPVETTEPSQEGDSESSPAVTESPVEGHGNNEEPVEVPQSTERTEQEEVQTVQPVEMSPETEESVHYQPIDSDNQVAVTGEPAEEVQEAINPTEAPKESEEPQTTEPSVPVENSKPENTPVVEDAVLVMQTELPESEAVRPTEQSSVGENLPPEAPVSGEDKIVQPTEENNIPSIDDTQSTEQPLEPEAVQPTEETSVPEAEPTEVPAAPVDDNVVPAVPEENESVPSTEMPESDEVQATEQPTLNENDEVVTKQPSSAEIETQTTEQSAESESPVEPTSSGESEPAGIEENEVTETPTEEIYSTETSPVVEEVQSTEQPEVPEAEVPQPTEQPIQASDVEPTEEEVISETEASVVSETEHSHLTESAEATESPAESEETQTAKNEEKPAEITDLMEQTESPVTSQENEGTAAPQEDEIMPTSDNESTVQPTVVESESTEQPLETGNQELEATEAPVKNIDLESTEAPEEITPVTDAHENVEGSQENAENTPESEVVTTTPSSAQDTSSEGSKYEESPIDAVTSAPVDNETEDVQPTTPENEEYEPVNPTTSRYIEEDTPEDIESEGAQTEQPEDQTSHSEEQNPEITTEQAEVSHSESEEIPESVTPSHTEPEVSHSESDEIPESVTPSHTETEISPETVKPSIPEEEGSGSEESEPHVATEEPQIIDEHENEVTTLKSVQELETVTESAESPTSHEETGSNDYSTEIPQEQTVAEEEDVPAVHSTEVPHQHTIPEEENVPAVHSTEAAMVEPVTESHEEGPESNEVEDHADNATNAPESNESAEAQPHEETAKPVEATEAPAPEPEQVTEQETAKPEIITESATMKPEIITETQTTKLELPSEATQAEVTEKPVETEEEKIVEQTPAPVLTSPPPMRPSEAPVKPSTTTTTTTTTTKKPEYQKPPKPVDEYDSLDEDKPGQEYLPTDDYDQEEEEQPYGQGTCRYAGKVYVSAQQIPRDDPCDFCFCFRSDIICLQQSCPPPIPGCHEEPISGFCCPRYECHVRMATMMNVTSTTTTTTTTLPPHFLSHAYKGAAARQGCLVQGRAYSVGQSIASASGPCMDCICGGDGSMKCEPKVCTPEPMIRQMMVNQESTIKHR